MGSFSNDAPPPDDVAATLSDIALRLAQGPSPVPDEMELNGLAEHVPGREYAGPSPYPEFESLQFGFVSPPGYLHPRVSMTLTLAPGVWLDREDLERVIGPCRRVPDPVGANGVVLMFDHAISEDGTVTAFATLTPLGNVGAMRFERVDWPDETPLNVKGMACLLAEPRATAALMALELGVTLGPPPPAGPPVTEYPADEDALEDTGYSHAALGVFSEGGSEPSAAYVRLTVAPDRMVTLEDLRRILGPWSPASDASPADVALVVFDFDLRPDEVPVTIAAVVSGAPEMPGVRVEEVLIKRV